MQAQTSPLLMQCYRQCFAGDGAVVDEPCLVAHALVAAACARLAAVLRKPPSSSKVGARGCSIARIECRTCTVALLNVAAGFAPTSMAWCSHRLRLYCPWSRAGVRASVTWPPEWTDAEQPIGTSSAPATARARWRSSTPRSDTPARSLSKTACYCADTAGAL